MRRGLFRRRACAGLYATDASLYQIEPLGVVVPRTLEDVATIVKIAAEEHLPIVPRGAATSLSGQTIGPAIIIDFSKYLNRIGIVDRDAMTVRVEPGVVLDQLNAHLKPLGLMFGPDVSTSDRATIGGMIGNNSAGARSLRYGKTVDHVRSIEAVLADGTTATLGPVPAEELDSVCSRGDSVGAIHRVVRDTVAAHAQAIRDRFPQILAQGQRLQPRRVRAGIAGPARGLARRALAVQPGQVDRRLGRDAGGRRRGRAQAGPAAGGAGTRRAVVRDHPGGARSPGRDCRDRPGRRRDARPDDPRPGGPEPALRRVSQLHRGPARGRAGCPVLRRLAAKSWPSGPATWPRNSRASRACWAFATDWSTPPRTISGRCARRDFRS